MSCDYGHTMPQKSIEQLQKKIRKHLPTEHIAGYVMEEIDHFLLYMQYHKLENMLINIEAFRDYLIHLDKENTIDMHAVIMKSDTVFADLDLQDMSLEDDPEIQNIYAMNKYDLTYFVSSHALQSIQMDQLQYFLAIEESSIHKLSVVMYRIKGHFLLMAGEFCHGTEMRIAIRRRMLSY